MKINTSKKDFVSEKCDNVELRIGKVFNHKLNRDEIVYVALVIDGKILEEISSDSNTTSVQSKNKLLR